MPEIGSVIVHEYGSLIPRGRGWHGSVVEPDDYLYLRSRALGDPRRYPLSIQVDVDGERLAIGSFVGVLPLPSGQVLEILPKSFSGPDAVNQARRALLRMAARSGPLPLRALDEAAQAPAPLPLHRALVLSFLAEVEDLLRQGLLAAYQGRTEERPFLHGRLDLGLQLRSRDLIPLSFWTVADEYREDRSENRLLRSALDRLLPFAKEIVPDRYGRVLEFFESIRGSTDVQGDFRAWASDRLAARYRSLEPWCRLILGDGVAPLSGEQSAPGLLFPMEKLFESYVGACIDEFLPVPFKLISQSRRHHLARQSDSPCFLLKPDFVIRRGGEDVAIVDAKWKLIRDTDLVAEDSQDDGPSQADLYQLYAYGRTYLGGSGPMALAYPRTQRFSRVSAPMLYNADPELNLVMVPVDLDRKPEALLGFLHDSLPVLDREV